MANNDLTLAVITPEREVLQETTDSVVIPAHDGELGILRGRAPLMCELGVGQLRYNKDGRVRKLLIDGGFAQVNDNKIVVLTNRAIPAEEITDTLIQAETAASNTPESADPDVREQKARAVRRVGVMRALRSA